MSCDNPLVQHYHKLEDDKWLLQLNQAPAGRIEIGSLKLELSLETVYRKVIFEKDPKPGSKAGKNRL